MRITTIFSFTSSAATTAAMAIPRPFIAPDITHRIGTRDTSQPPKHQLHSHDEYGIIQRRCVMGKNCRDICSNDSIVGVLACNWGCGGNSETPTCPESDDIQQPQEEPPKVEKRQSRCVMGKDCTRICSNESIIGMMACNWECDGNAETPTCPESSDIER